MEIVLNSNFSEISYNEMELIEGGGWREFGYAMGGTLLIAGSPIVAPVGVAKLGRKYGAKTIAFAGSVTKEAVACNEAGIDAFFPIVRGISTLEEAMDPDTAKANMAAAAEQVFRLL